MENNHGLVIALVSIIGTLLPVLYSHSFSKSKKLTSDTETLLKEYYQPIYYFLLNENLNQNRNYKEISKIIVEKSENHILNVSPKLKTSLLNFHGATKIENKDNLETLYFNLFFCFQEEYFATVNILPKGNLLRKQTYTGFHKFTYNLYFISILISYTVLLMFIARWGVMIFIDMQKDTDVLFSKINYQLEIIPLFAICVLVTITLLLFLFTDYIVKKRNSRAIYIGKDNKVYIKSKRKINKFFKKNTNNWIIKYRQKAESFWKIICKNNKKPSKPKSS